MYNCNTIDQLSTIILGSANYDPIYNVSGHFILYVMLYLYLSAFTHSKCDPQSVFLVIFTNTVLIELMCFWLFDFVFYRSLLTIFNVIKSSSYIFKFT